MKKISPKADKLTFRTETLRTLARAVTELELEQVVGGQVSTASGASRPTGPAGSSC